MGKAKDFGPAATLVQIADQMNTIPRLEEDLRQSVLEENEVKAERQRRDAMLAASRNELGRMLQASRLLNGSDYRIIHRDEAVGEEMQALFGMYSVRG